MKHVRLFILGFFMLTFTAFAETLTFASPESVAPKIFKENGVVRGTYIDIIAEVCKRMKVNPKFVQYPWPRAMSYTKSGRVDAIFPPFKTKEREDYFYFPSEPVSVTRNVVFALKSRKLKIAKLEDLKGLVVAVTDQYSYGEKFDEFKKRLKLHVNRSEETQISMLAYKGKTRIDAAVASEEAFKYLSKKAGTADAFEIVYVISETPAFVAFSKAGGEKSRMRAEEFGRILLQMKKEGVIEEISDRYLK